ncbi:hypothetical protein N836_24590 [Leptolyngbya sp. Heron Island J]|nr:hypothetical protein N836_24590 [Leptolyngbya sp. Heron Island J]
MWGVTPYLVFLGILLELYNHEVYVKPTDLEPGVWNSTGPTVQQGLVLP